MVLLEDNSTDEVAAGGFGKMVPEGRTAAETEVEILAGTAVVPEGCEGGGMLAATFILL